MLTRLGVLAVLACSLIGCGENGGASAPPPTGGGSTPSWPPEGPRAVSATWPPFTVMGRRTDPGNLKWRIDPADCPVAPERFREAAIRAMNRWQDTGAARFLEVEPARQADLVFSWHGGEHDECRFIEWDGGVAHAAGEGPALAVIHFNKDVDWDRRSLFCAALHEIGHILGLGHSPVAHAVMYGGYDETHVALTEHDLAGLHTIYGGGEDAANDLAIVHFDADGSPKTAAPALRRVLPADCRFTVLDANGDGNDDVLVWRGDRKLGPMMRYAFMINARIEKSTGPFVGITRPDRDTWVAEAQNGDTVLLDVRDDGRYVASGFNDAGIPGEPLPKGPLVLKNGLADRDGDGVLEQRTPLSPCTASGQKIVASADVDGDGHEDRLVVSDSVSGSFIMKWLLTAGDPNGAAAGATITAKGLCVGDLDGDGRPEGVVQGLVKTR